MHIFAFVVFLNFDFCLHIFFKKLEDFCKKNEKYNIRVIGDHSSFDYGLLNANIKRLFKGKVLGFNYVRSMRNNEITFRHRRPLCIGSFYEGINNWINKNDNSKWFINDINELKLELEKCPYKHDHMAINDAKQWDGSIWLLNIGFKKKKNLK